MSDSYALDTNDNNRSGRSRYDLKGRLKIVGIGMVGIALIVFAGLLWSKLLIVSILLLIISVVPLIYCCVQAAKLHRLNFIECCVVFPLVAGLVLFLFSTAGTISYNPPKVETAFSDSFEIVERIDDSSLCPVDDDSKHIEKFLVKKGETNSYIVNVEKVGYKSFFRSWDSVEIGEACEIDK